MLRRPVRLAFYTAFGAAFGLAGSAPAADRDPQIAAILAQVSPSRLQGDVQRLVDCGTRSSFSETATGARGVAAARDWIASTLREAAAQSGGRMTVSVDSFTQHADGRRVTRDVILSNVIATLAGDEPGRTYVMSAHYDSRNSSNEDATRDAPGADDDGSGVAAVIEAARAMAPMQMHATVIFALYDAEEQGLFGSAHHAQALKASGVKIAGDFNNDIVGASVGDKGERNPGVVRIFSEALPITADPKRINLLGTENDSPSRELARFAAEAIDAYVPGLHARMVFRADRFLRGGDHLSFNEAGFPAIRFVEPVENFAHQHQDVRMEGGVRYGDLPDAMDFDYLTRVTRANLAGLATLALAPAPPDDVAILTRALTNDTTLAWSASPRAVRYEVVRRETTEPNWTDVTDAGVTTHATLPFSKDEWLFGVRAVDQAGHRSVAMFPSPRSK